MDNRQSKYVRPNNTIELAHYRDQIEQSFRDRQTYQPMTSGQTVVEENAARYGKVRKKLSSKAGLTATIGASMAKPMAKTLQNFGVSSPYLMPAAGLGQGIAAAASGTKHAARNKFLLAQEAAGNLSGKEKVASNVFRGGNLISQLSKAMITANMLGAAAKGVTSGGMHAAGNLLGGGTLGSALSSGATGGLGSALSGMNPISTLGGMMNPTMAMGLVGANIASSMVLGKKLSPIKKKNINDPKNKKNSIAEATQAQLNMLISDKGSGLNASDQLKIQLLTAIADTSTQFLPYLGELYVMQDYKEQKEGKAAGDADDTYGEKLHGKGHNLGLVSKGIDKASTALSMFSAKYDVIGQIAGAVLTGESPKAAMAKLKDRGYETSEEKQSLRKQELATGVRVPILRLLGTDGTSLSSRGGSLESQNIILLRGIYDISRHATKELMTMRTGMGISENMFNYGSSTSFSKGIFGQLSDAFGNTIGNIPGLNAVGNVASSILNLPKMMASAATKTFDWAKGALFGKEYLELQDDTQLEKKMGIYKSLQEKATDFVAKGLPHEIKKQVTVAYEQLTVQKNMYDVLNLLYQVQSGAEHSYKDDMYTKEREATVWVPEVGRYMSTKAAETYYKTLDDQRTETLRGSYDKSLIGKLFNPWGAGKERDKERDDTMTGEKQFKIFGKEIGSTKGLYKFLNKYSGNQDVLYGKEKDEDWKSRKLLDLAPTTGIEEEMYSRDAARKQRDLKSMPASLVRNLKGMRGGALAGTVIGASALTGVGGLLPLLFSGALGSLGAADIIKRRTDNLESVENLKKGQFDDIEEQTGIKTYGGLGRGDVKNIDELISPREEVLQSQAPSRRVSTINDVVKWLKVLRDSTNMVSSKIGSLDLYLKEMRDHIKEFKERVITRIDNIRTYFDSLSLTIEKTTDSTNEILYDILSEIREKKQEQQEPQRRELPKVRRRIKRRKFGDQRARGDLDDITESPMDREGVLDRLGSLPDEMRRRRPRLRSGRADDRRQDLIQDLLGEGADDYGRLRAAAEGGTGLRKAVVGEKFKGNKITGYPELVVGDFDVIGQRDTKDIFKRAGIETLAEGDSIHRTAKMEMEEIQDKRKAKEQQSFREGIISSIEAVSKKLDALSDMKKSLKEKMKDKDSWLGKLMGWLTPFLAPIGAALIPLVAGWAAFNTNGKVGGKAALGIAQRGATKIASSKLGSKAIEKVATSKTVQKAVGSKLAQKAISSKAGTFVGKVGGVLDKGYGLAAKGAKALGNLPVVGKFFSAIGPKVLGKLGITVGKGGLKAALKKIPILGAVFGTGFAISRAMKGDYIGAMGEFASGVASIFPGIGTAVSLGIDGLLMLRDMKKEKEDAKQKADKSFFTKIKESLQKGLAWYVGNIPFVGGWLAKKIMGEDPDMDMKELVNAEKEKKKEKKLPKPDTFENDDIREAKRLKEENKKKQAAYKKIQETYGVDKSEAKKLYEKVKDMNYDEGYEYGRKYMEENKKKQAAYKKIQETYGVDKSEAKKLYEKVKDMNYDEGYEYGRKYMEENKKKQAAYKESTTSMGKSVDTAVDNSEKWENQLKDYKEMMGATEEDLRNEAKQFMQKRKDDIEYMKTQLAMSKEEIDKYVSDFDNSEIGQRTNYLVNKYMQPKSDNTKLLKLKKLMSPSAFKLLGDDAEKLQQLIEQGKIKEADYGQYKYVMVEEEVKNQQFDTGGKDIDQRKVVTNRKIEEDKARLDILKEKMSDHAFKLLNNKPDQFPVLLEEGKIKKRIWRDYYTLTNEGEKDLEKMMGEQNRRKENMEKGAASFTFTSTSANTHTFAPASVKLPEDDGPGTSTPNKTAIPKPTFIPETKEEPITNTGMPDPNVSAALSTAETKTIKKDDTSEKSKTSMETSSGFALPTPHNVVTSPYGKRNVKKGSKFHTGADFRAREGEDIKALLPGTVTMSKLIPWGNLVVDHGGFQARYIHNKDILVKSGDTVEKGQVIAKAGGRGRQGPRSYTPHLHLDIIRGGNKIDPELFLHGLDSSWMPQYAPSISPSRQLSAKLGGKTDPKIDKTKPDIEAGDGFMSDVAGWGEGIVRKGISTVTDHYSTKYGDLAEEITSTITDGSVEKAGDKLIKKGATKGITGLTEKALTDKNTFKKVAKVLGDKTMDVLSTTKLIMQNKALRKKLLKKIPGIGNILGIGDFIGDIANADYSDKGFAEKAELFSKKLSLAAIGQLPFVGEDAAEMLNDTVMNIGKEGGILRFAKHGMIAKSPTPVVIGDDPYGEMAVPLRPDLFDNMMDRFGFKERPISMKGLEGITDVFKALVEQIEDVVESKSSVDNKSPEKVQQQQAQQPIIIPINNGQGNTNAGLEGRAQHQLDENYTRTDASIDKLIDKMFKNVCIAFENGLSNHSFKNTTVQSFF